VDRFLIIYVLVDVRPGKSADLVNKNLLRLIDAFIIYVHALDALGIKLRINDQSFLKQHLCVKAEEILSNVSSLISCSSIFSSARSNISTH